MTADIGYLKKQVQWCLGAVVPLSANILHEALGAKAGIAAIGFIFEGVLQTENS
jgi:hypothetical protein